MSFVKALFSWLSMAVLSVINSPVTQTVVTSAKSALDSLPEGTMQRAMELVWEAKDLPCSNGSKLQYVYGTLEAEYPELGENMLKWLIETSLMVAKGVNEK